MSNSGTPGWPERWPRPDETPADHDGDRGGQEAPPPPYGTPPTPPPPYGPPPSGPAYGPPPGPGSEQPPEPGYGTRSPNYEYPPPPPGYEQPPAGPGYGPPPPRHGPGYGDPPPPHVPPYDGPPPPQPAGHDHEPPPTHGAPYEPGAADPGGTEPDGYSTWGVPGAGGGSWYPDEPADAPADEPSPWPGGDQPRPDGGQQQGSGTTTTPPPQVPPPPQAPPPGPQQPRPAGPPPRGSDFHPPPPGSGRPPQPDWPGQEDWLVPAKPRRRFPRVLLVLAVVGALIVVSGGGAGAYFILQGRNGESEGPRGAQVASDLFPPPAQSEGDGVYQSINDVAAMGTTVVAAGSEYGGAVSRPRFLVSTDGGTTWQVGEVRPGRNADLTGPGASNVVATPAGWLAVGGSRQNRAAWTSEDGRTWTEHSVPNGVFDPDDKITAMIRAPEGYVIVGYNTGSSEGTDDDRPVVWLSATGETWQRIDSEQLELPNEEGSVRQLEFAGAYGGAILIGGRLNTGDENEEVDGFWRSTDGGRSWEGVDIPQADGSSGLARGLAATSTGFFVLRQAHDTGRYGVLLFSQDGQDWQPVARIAAAGGLSPSFRGLTGNDQGLVAMATAEDDNILVFRSSTADGRQWNEPTDLAAEEDRVIANSQPTSNGGAVVGGTIEGGDTDYYLAAVTGPGQVTPIDLRNVPNALNPEHEIHDLLASEDLVVAAGNTRGRAAVWASPDGSAWQPVELAGDVAEQRLTNVAFGEQGWLAVGEGSGRPLVMTSPEGRSWTHRDIEPFRPAEDEELGAAASVYGPSGYVIVGIAKDAGGATSAAVWHSSDLQSWIRVEAEDVASADSERWMNDVAATSSSYIAVGAIRDPDATDDQDERPAAWTSSDGQDWTATPLPLPEGTSWALLNHVAVDGATAIATGTARTPAGEVVFAMRSTDDGQTWDHVDFPRELSGAGRPETVTALTATPQGFLAAGSLGGGHELAADVVTWMSDDGQEWQLTAPEGTGLSGPGAQVLNAFTSLGDRTLGVGRTVTAHSEDVTLWQVPATQ